MYTYRFTHIHMLPLLCSLKGQRHSRAMKTPRVQNSVFITILQLKEPGHLGEIADSFRARSREDEPGLSCSARKSKNVLKTNSK